MRSKGLIILAIICIIQSNNPVYSTVSQIHFGTTSTPHVGLTVTWHNSGGLDSLRWGYDSTSYIDLQAIYYRVFEGKVLYDYTFPDLESDTTLYYQIYDSYEGTWTTTKTFRTASKKKNSFSFKVLGDSQTHASRWGEISSVTQDSDFTLFTGDITSPGGDMYHWNNWYRFGKEFLENNLFLSAQGNHELDNDPQVQYYKNMLTLPSNNEKNSELYYSFNYKNALFICLNSSDAWSTTQYNWLINTLENNKDAQWKIVWFHIPFFTSPAHENEMDHFFTTWWKAFDDYGVDLIFNGHTHNYQRSVPINRNVSTNSPVGSYGSYPSQGRCQIVTGGAGGGSHGPGSGWFIDNSQAGLHYIFAEVYNDSVTIKALDQNNDIFDSFSLVKDFNLSIEATSTTVCEGEQVTLRGSGADTYVWDNDVVDGVPFTPSESKVYTLIGSSSEGLSDTVSIEINIREKSFTSESYTLCSGDSLLWRGHYYQNAGTYYDSYQTIYGCDSIFELQLDVNLSYNNIENVQLCKGDSIEWRGSVYKSAGIYYNNNVTTNGCDSIHELHLTVNIPYSYNENANICEGDSLEWRGGIYKSAGSYSKNFVAATGCDSVYTLHLSIDQVPNPPQIAGATNVQETQNKIYTVQEDDNCINEWHAVNGVIVTESNTEVEVHWPEAGTSFIYLTTTNINNCTSKSELEIAISNEYNSIYSTTGEDRVKVYPNPAENFINIEVPEAFIMDVYKLSGVKMMSTSQTTTDISSLPSGNYFLIIRNRENELVESQHLVIE